MHTRTMPVWNTGTGAEAGEGSPDLSLRGYRAKWQKRSSASVSGCDSDAGAGGFGDNEFQGVTQQGNAAACSSQEPEGLVQVEDLSKDDLLADASLRGFDSEQLQQHHARQVISNTDLGVFKFPWEKGRLAKIFMDQPAVTVKVPKLQPSSRNLSQMHVQVDDSGSMSAKPVLKLDKQVTGMPVFLDVIKSHADVPQSEDRDAKRTQALKAWWVLLSHRLTASAVGLKVTVEATADNVLETALSILDATFAVKSPGTLLRRVYAIQAFDDWCVEALSKHWLPVQEFDVWSYVKWLQATKAPSTKAGSLVEALRFSWYLLGCEGCDTAERSLRVKGVSAQMRAMKRPWRPADLLSVNEIKMLHKLLDDPNAPLGDRCIAGHLLHMLYSRSRWSDLVAVSSIYMDPESQYLEVSTRCHKSARGAEQKTKLLPIVCPCVGVDGGNWALTYFEVRHMCNLMLPLDGAGPMMCCPLNAAASVWTKRAMTSEEGSDFMRKVLNAPKTEERRISSHSLKSTMMSWTAKFGLSEHSRAVLARHASKAATATAVYSRDLLSPILRELNHVIKSVRNGSFNPDSTRSGMLAAGAMPYFGGTPLPMQTEGAPATPVPDVDRKSHGSVGLEHPSQQDGCQVGDHSEVQGEVHDLLGRSEEPSPSLAAVEADADDYSETTEENSVQSSSESDLECSGEQHRGVFDFPTDYVINTKSLVIHYVKKPGLLGCGRKLTPSYSKVFGLSGIRCSRCFDV